MYTPRSVRRTRGGRALAGVLLVSCLALAGCSSADSDDKSSSAAGAPGARKAAPGAADDAAPGAADDAAPGAADDAAPGAADDAAPGAADDAAPGAADDAAPGAADSAVSGAGGAKATAAPRPAADAIIRTASLTVQVKDVAKALDAARATATDAGGFVGDETTTRDDRGRERTRLVLRVPTDHYDQVLADLGGSGRIVERTAKAQDVTDQVVDVESRITSQRASVARVRELMDRADKLSDVVALEGELSSRESDLEALLARRSSLKDRTSLATITLSLSGTPVREAAEKADEPDFVDALAGGWDAFVTTLRWIAMVLGAVLPFAASAALLVVLWVRLGRSRLTRRRAPAPAPAPVPVPAGSASPSGTGSLPAAPPLRGKGGEEA